MSARRREESGDYYRGFIAGQSAAREEFERTLVVLREENSTFRKIAEGASARADSLVAELAKSIVVSAPPPRAPAMPTVPIAPTSKDPIRGLGDVFAPVDFTDPDSTFKNIDEASLLFPSTDGGQGAEA